MNSEQIIRKTQLPHISPRLKSSQTTVRLTSPGAKLRPKLSLSPRLEIPKISAKSCAVLHESSQRIVFHKNFRFLQEIASLTKILTCIVCIKLASKLKIPLAQNVTVSFNAGNIAGTSAGLKAGDVLTVFDLLHGLMLPSGNDAALALSEFFEMFLGSSSKISYFVMEMNKLAKSIGMKNSKFKNPHGLSLKANWSTAEDVCVLAKYSLENKTFADIVARKNFKCKVQGNNCREIEWVSTNILLGGSVDGVKTGFTNKAGACLCVRYRNGQDSVIITVLGYKNKGERWTQVPLIAKWALEKLCLI